MVDQINSIIGQPHATNQLKALLKNKRIPHALLFSGPSGVGKFFTAVQFVKSLNIESNYQKISHFEEPFVKLIMPLPRGKNEVSENSGTEKLSEKQLEELKAQLLLKQKNPYYKIQIEGANAVKISSIREIKKYLSFNYSDIDYRVIIIEEAHQMNKEAQNALLKSLEEPPEGVIMILITPYEARLLPTILSRCWHVKFNNLSNELIRDILVKHFEIDESIAEKAALFSTGSVHKALELVENDMQSLLESTVQILRFSLGGWFNSAYMEFRNATDDFNTVKVKEILNLINIWLTDVQKNRINYDSYYFSDRVETLTKFNNNFPQAQIENISKEINDLIQSMDKNILLNIILLNLILKLNFISTWK